MLTKQIKKPQVLRIELKDWEGNMKYAVYDDFKVANEGKKYRLESIGKYTGDAGLRDIITNDIVGL